MTTHEGQYSHALRRHDGLRAAPLSPDAGGRPSRAQDAPTSAVSEDVG
ncbi:MAG: hypothetical protein OXE44_19030 [Nitrospinae bacterium]|nr:hypothetical protein [Nitrospinota bacterium]